MKFIKFDYYICHFRRLYISGKLVVVVVVLLLLLPAGAAAKQPLGEINNVK